MKQMFIQECNKRGVYGDYVLLGLIFDHLQYENKQMTNQQIANFLDWRYVITRGQGIEIAEAYLEATK